MWRTKHAESAVWRIGRLSPTISSSGLGTQIRHETRSAFVAQSLLSALALCSDCSLPCLIVGAGTLRLSHLRVAFGDEISSESHSRIVRESISILPHHARFLLESAPNESKVLALRLRRSRPQPDRALVSTQPAS